MNSRFSLDRVRVVLVRTTHPGNIGAAARAMKTMGLQRLYLVQPSFFPHAEAVARASGAVDVLDHTVVVSSLAEALHDCVFSAGLTARRRERSVKMQLLRQATPEILSMTTRGEVALVFGTESAGLSNAEISLCSLPVMIPTSASYSSLNLGSAVQLLCYELHSAALSPNLPPPQSDELASFDEIEGLHVHLLRAMTSSGFYDPNNPRRLLSRLRRLFGRIRLERDEVNILRGILAALENKPPPNA